MTAPWWGIVWPRQAAACFVAASRSSLLVSLLLCWLALTTGSIGVLFWSWTESLEWGYDEHAPGAITWAIQTRSAGDLWAAWCQEPLVRQPALVTSIVLLLGLILLTLLAAWTFVPPVHGSASRKDAHRRALRAAASFAGMVVLLVILAAVAAECGGRMANRSLVGGPWSLWEPGWIEYSLLHAWVVVLGVGIIRARRVVRSVCPAAAPSCDAHPRCEGCGYDLWHRPSEGRCPECGLDIGLSLDPHLARPGSPWEQRPNLRTWLSTTAQVLLRPKWFYRKLRLRTTDETSWAFAAWHFLAISLASGAVAAGSAEVDWLQAASPADAFWRYAWSVPLACWVGHRLLGFFVIYSTPARRYLPDHRWMRKVVDYQVVLLWLFCAANVLILMLDGVLSGKAFWVGGTRLPPWAWFGLPSMILLVNVVLVVFWFWRIRVACRAIRWSNL